MSFTLEQVPQGIGKAVECIAPAGYDACFDYGVFTLGEAPFTREFAIKNLLRVPLVLDSFDFATLTPALWSLDASECRGRTLQPGQSCVLKLTFIPPPKPGALGAPAPDTCNLQAKFPTSDAGCHLQALGFQLRNTNTVPLHVLGAKFTRNDEKTFDVSPASFGTLAPGQIIPFSLLARPVVLGTQYGVFEFDLDGPVPKVVVCLSITITRPGVSGCPAVPVFGGAGGSSGTPISFFGT